MKQQPFEARHEAEWQAMEAWLASRARPRRNAPPCAALDDTAFPAAYRRLCQRLRELNAEVVHTHSSKAGILGRRAANRVKAPAVIHTIHGLAFTASTSPVVNAAYKALERRAAPRTTRIVCVADAMREQSLRAGIGRPEQYVTVYSGMETAPFLNPPVPRDEVRVIPATYNPN